MNFKSIIPVALLLIAGTFVVSANSPKSEPKELKQEVTTNDEPTLHWYKVTYDATHLDGYIVDADAYEGAGEQSTMTSDCPSGNTKDCLRGFTSELANFPDNTAGDGVIRRGN